jgi:hypothetical protein
MTWTSWSRTRCSSAAASCAFGVFDGDEVLDAEGVEHLATEPFGHDAGADALAGGVHRGGSGRRTASHHEHVERALLGQAGGIAIGRTGVELGDDLLQAHTTLAEHLAVQEHGGHGHDLAVGDLLLEQGAVDGGVANARVEHAHQVQGLHHVGAVLAGEAEVGLEVQVAVERLHLLDDVLGGLRRVAAHVQQCEHQRRELVAEGDAGEAHCDVGVDPADLEGGPPMVGAVPGRREQGRQLRDLLEELAQLARLG